MQFCILNVVNTVYKQTQNTNFYCIWQPGGWINIKQYNKIKNYIIIKHKSIDCLAMSDNYLKRKSGNIAEIEWFWQSVEQVAVVASISPPEQEAKLSMG